MTTLYRRQQRTPEHTVATWLLGFSMGIMLVLGAEKLFSEPQELPDVEAIRAEKLLDMYQRGRKDALTTNPVSFELEQTCLEVWANKQGATK